MGMGYVYMWVEGNDNLHEFCKKIFGEQPTFVEKKHRAMRKCQNLPQIQA